MDEFIICISLVDWIDGTNILLFCEGKGVNSITSWLWVRSSIERIFTSNSWHYKSKQNNNSKVTWLCKGLGIFVGLGLLPTTSWTETGSSWMPWKKEKTAYFTAGTNDAIWLQFQVAFPPITQWQMVAWCCLLLNPSDSIGFCTLMWYIFRSGYFTDTYSVCITCDCDVFIWKRVSALSCGLIPVIMSLAMLLSEYT